ncbi:hypothetical protein [Oceanobacillus oncorhynchi]|uniref:hypothetical protein n=1 Tax=Oceanobacillus oncorhynchi TaxID=545501 RepID=UPI002F96CE40
MSLSNKLRARISVKHSTQEVRIGFFRSGRINLTTLLQLLVPSKTVAADISLARTPRL